MPEQEFNEFDLTYYPDKEEIHLIDQNVTDYLFGNYHDFVGQQPTI